MTLEQITFGLYINSNYYATLISVPTFDSKEGPDIFFICFHSTEHSQNIREPDERYNTPINT